MTKKTTDIVAYITPIGWLVAFFAGTREESKFHLNQTLVIWLCNIILGILAYIPIVGIVAGILSLVMFVFWLLGLIGACQGNEKELPLIGSIKILK